MLSHGGHIGQLRQAFGGASRNATHLACLDKGQQGRCTYRRSIKTTREQVLHHGAGAAIRHMQHEDVCRHLQIFKRQMPRTAIACRTIAELAGVLFGIGHQLGNILDGQVGVHHIQAGHFGQQADGNKVLFRVVGQLVKNIGVHCQRADMTEDDGALVIRAGHFLHGDIACGAGFVFHKNVLPQGFGEFCRR